VRVGNGRRLLPARETDRRLRVRAVWFAVAAFIAANLVGTSAAQAQCSGNTCTVTIGSDPGTSSSGATGAAGTLSFALAYANAQSSPVTINIQTNVTLSGPLSPILNSVTINGNGFTISGNNSQRIFFVGVDSATQTSAAVAGSIVAQTQNVSINNMTLANGAAIGGAGGVGGGGGGGMGAGGALFVNQSANVTLSGVSFASNHATGGAGAATSGSLGTGGGGLGGAGGSGLGEAGAGGIFGNGAATTGGGGGVFGNGGPQAGGGGGYSGAGGNGNTSGASGAAGLLSISGLSGSGGSGAGSSGNGGANGGGGGGEATAAAGGGGGFGGGNAVTGVRGGNGGFGGGGGGGGNGGAGGAGGFGGGGGGGDTVGGHGGVGGGGGGATVVIEPGTGGAGGFGGGGGGAFGGPEPGQGGAGGFGGGGGAGANSGSGGAGGFGAGNASNAQGGGGAAMGGAVFVAKGGTLTIDGSGSTSGGSVTGGSGANNGLAFGSGFFVQGSALTFGAGNYMISDGITDQNGSGGSAAADGFGGTGGQSSITKNGSGTLTLSGTNTYSGATIINGGTLEVDGSIANSSTVTVNSGGTLSGTGIVDPATTTIMSGGTLAPGNAANPTGTLTITGNLAFQSGALYVVQVTPSADANTIVSGSATLTGATVNAQFASGSYLTKQYTIFTATGGLGGTTFSGLTNINLPAGFSDSLSYSGGSVLLNLTATGLSPTGLNTNQQNVATRLNNFFNSGGALPPAFVNVFGLTGGALGNALSQLDGEAATGAERGAFQMTNEFLSLMLDPFVYGRAGSFGPGGGAIGFAPEQQDNLPPDIALAYASILTKAPPQTFEQRWTAWGSAYGGANNASGDPATGSTNVRASTFGFAGGMDYHVTPNTIVGFALAGGGLNWGLASGMGGGRSDALQSGVYGISYLGPAYISGALAFTNHWFDTSRSALGDSLSATFTGQSYGGRLEGGYRFAVLPTLGVTPYAAVQAQDFRTPAYSESDLTGGGFGLSFASMNATDVRTELGSRFDAPTLVAGLPLIFRGRLAWAHDFVSNPSLGAAFEALPGGSFTVFGAAIPHDSALTSAGAELFLTPRWTLLAKFDGEFANGSQTYAGSGTLRYSW
jgi:uncharacterized protein with beta-barrel porin domain